MTKKSQLKWDIRFLQMAKLIGSWSKDPSTKCGAVIVNEKVMISSGFNGYPSRVLDCEHDSRELKLSRTIHAEVNAILYAKRDLINCTLYVTPIPPCDRCATIIAQAGIKRVVIGIEPELDIARWQQFIDLAQDMFVEANIQVDRIVL